MLCVVVILGCAPDRRTVAERYPGKWIDEFNVDISRTLAAHNARDCGEYRWRRSADSNSEFLVVCSRDGRKWQQYLVFTASQKAIGPDKLDPSIAFSL